MLQEWGLEPAESGRFLATAKADDPLAAALAAAEASAATEQPEESGREELAVWLQSAKLAEYLEPLLAAGLKLIDVLALSDEKLKELGVVKAMHRQPFARESRAFSALALPVQAHRLPPPR